jgi:hypothetical protein
MNAEDYDCRAANATSNLSSPFGQRAESNPVRSSSHIPNSDVFLYPVYLFFTGSIQPPKIQNTMDES